MLTSVIVPVFREHPERLRACVDSVLAQAGAAVELIVVDDDGIDRRAELPRDARLRLASSGGVGLGPAAARNVGLELARGDAVTFVDSDDAMLPGKLEALVAPALAFGAALGDALLRVDDPARPDPGIRRDRAVAADRGTGHRALRTLAAIDAPLWPVFRRDAIAGLRFLEAVRFSEDSAFNLCVIGRLGGAWWVGRPLHLIRVRAGSLSRGPDAVGDARRGYAAITDHLATAPDLDAGLRGELIAIYRRKSRTNEAYAAWADAHPGGRFDEFIAARADAAPAGRPGTGATDLA